MTRSFVLLIAALLGAVACASPAAFDGPLVISADAPHREQVEAAAERWSNATGLGITVAENGTPVRFAPRVFNDGAETCGYAELSSGGAAVMALHVATDPRVSCSDRTLLHELGHLITITYGHDAQAPHTEEGSATLMAPIGEVDWIDVDSLLFVCERAPCATFVSEPPPRLSRSNPD